MMLLFVHIFYKAE